MEVLAAQLSGPRLLAASAAREMIERARREILAGGDSAAELLEAAQARLDELARGGPRRLINATGIVLHTNLGRAPLAAEAAAAAAEIGRGYSNLELDLETGKRGSRQAHIEGEFRALSGAEAAMAVNNNAAAVLLALAATAAGGQVVVGRDQLVEIGGSFRIPEILEQSGAMLVEVGTTNRTRVSDYAAAIGPATRALLRVHQSNFRTHGFSESVSLEELCRLARERGLPVIDDLGSGALEPVADEPVVRASVAAGAELVCCSADKLLGGPQAGIIAGREEAVERCRSHPLARALRLDKLQLAALAATLRMHREGRVGEIPAVAMLEASPDELERRAERLGELIGPVASVEPSQGRPGGGTLPTTVLNGPACFIDPGPLGADRLMDALRAADPPVVARIERGRVILDPRTMAEEEVEAVAVAVRSALV